jgi:hypothetical protein
MSIMGTGKTWVPVDHDDIEMLKAKEHGKYGILAVGCRDICVIDVFTEVRPHRHHWICPSPDSRFLF